MGRHRRYATLMKRRRLGAASLLRHAWFAGLVGALSALGCASVERGRYGVSSLEVRGTEQVDEAALKACLVTLERPYFELKLGVGGAKCNEPPFDTSAPAVRLWRWPWTEWPTFNHAVFKQDNERILRWYRARGFYDARIVEVRYDPPEAATPGTRGSCDPEREECLVHVIVVVDEGLPVSVKQVRVRGADTLEAELVRELEREVATLRGARFDEAIYDQHKLALRDLLKLRGFAAAAVDGKVSIATADRTANVDIDVDPGKIHEFGVLEVSGHGTLPKAPIVAAAALPTGARYDPAVLEEIQAEVFALGAFSAVEVDERVDPKRGVVDVTLRVTPLAPDQLRVGFGVLSGASRRTDTGELVSIPQWDLHVFGNYEKRHVFGSLGRLGIEERPRLIFNESFPRFSDPALGNILSVRLNQPGLVEPRTDAFTSSAWDYGPDPFLGFHRSDIFVRVGLRRGFFTRRLMGTLAVQQDFFIVPRTDNLTSDGSETPTPYAFQFLEQDLRLDLRDNRLRPRLGAYLGLNVSESARWVASDWTQFRLVPEARGYLPLPLDIVFAARFALGAIFIVEASPDLDELSRELGPTSYRLRGGGANSNRGFLPGELGVGVQGGLRRWESSAELRFAFGESFGLVGFLDMGDVNDGHQFRFAQLNSSAGGGLRYHTVIGVLRLDLGFRIPAWQRADGSDGIESDSNKLPWSRTPGALHFTIGESF